MPLNGHINYTASWPPRTEPAVPGEFPARPAYHLGMTLLAYVLMGFSPGLFWLWYFRRKDDLEPEPRLMLLRVFALGCAAAFGVLLARPHYEWLLPAAPGWPRDLTDAFLVTALVEEAAKVLAFLVGAYFHPELDEPLDGIIYGVAAALGFASVENVMYLVHTADPGVVAVRAFTATLGHVAFTGAIGFFFGVAKFAPSGRRLLLLPSGLACGVIFHGAYDVFLFRGQRELRLLSLVCVLPLILVLLGLKIRWSRSVSREFHPDLARRRCDRRPDA